MLLPTAEIPTVNLNLYTVAGDLSTFREKLVALGGKHCGENVRTKLLLLNEAAQPNLSLLNAENRVGNGIRILSSCTPLFELSSLPFTVTI